MNNILLITSIILFASSGVFIFLFIKTKIKMKKMIEDIKTEILSTNRTGCYKEILNLQNDEQHKNHTGDKYESFVYVKEVDRYTNGFSKIELVKIEVISGYNANQYDWVIKLTEKRFCSIKKTDEIEWLESEENIKKLRKEKLQKIIK